MAHKDDIVKALEGVEEIAGTIMDTAHRLLTLELNKVIRFVQESVGEIEVTEIGKLQDCELKNSFTDTTFPLDHEKVMHLESKFSKDDVFPHIVPHTSKGIEREVNQKELTATKENDMRYWNKPIDSVATVPLPSNFGGPEDERVIDQHIPDEFCIPEIQIRMPIVKEECIARNSSLEIFKISQGLPLLKIESEDNMDVSLDATNFGIKLEKSKNVKIKKEKCPRSTICVTCTPPKVFARPDYLQDHIRKHHDETIQKIVCGYGCGYTTLYKSVMRKHVGMVHEKKFDYKCNQCDFATFYNCKLKEHVRCVHEKIKDKNCHMCSAKFSKTENLKAHVRDVHQKTKKFLCNLCPYSGNRKGKFTLHLQKEHGIQDFDMK